MKVRILDVKTGEPVNAVIKENTTLALPSPPHDEGWRFNFAKLSKRTPNSFTYVLVTEETPHIIEGCLIFQLKDGVIPHGAYIEVAPHNRGKEKKYDHVTGSLIAYAYQLSLEKGKGAMQVYFISMYWKKRRKMR